MRLILSLILAFGVAAGAAYAGCGKKVTSEGTLKKLDSDKKMIVVVDEGGEEVKLTVTMDTKVVGADGNEAALADLVGKNVTAISEHSKLDEVRANKT